MGKEKCIAWTTWWWWTYGLFIYLDFKNLWSYHDVNNLHKSKSTKVNGNIYDTHKSILNICWVNLVTWVRKCLWCTTLGGTN
jgi:hypothetical protein